MADPDFLTISANDPAFAMATKLTNVLRSPAGYPFLVACKMQGAGAQRMDVDTNDSFETQNIKGIDIAVDSSVLDMSTDGPGVLPGGFVIMNQPIDPTGGVQIDVTPQGTGTAEGFYHFKFGKRAVKDQAYTLNKCDNAVITLGTSVRNDAILDPTPSVTRTLVRCMHHAANGTALRIVLGNGGKETVVQCRHAAVNTDATPFCFEPIYLDPQPGEILLGENYGGAGVLGAFYQFQ